MPPRWPLAGCVMSDLALQEESFADDLSASDARRLTDQIKLALDSTWQLGLRAWEGRAWVVLGYASWDEYCTKEFGTSHLKLPRAERDEVIPSLRAAGMSGRAIATLTGLAETTVRRALPAAVSTAPNGAVDSELDDDGTAPLVGTDGRSYQRRPTRSDVLARQTRAVYLQKQGMTQEKIAQQLGVGQATVSTDLAAMAELIASHGGEVSTETLGAAFTDGGRTNVAMIADYLGVEVAPVRDLAKLARQPMSAVVTTLDVVVETVVEADEWLDDAQRRAALAVIVPDLVRSLTLMNRVLEATNARDLSQADLTALHVRLAPLSERVLALGGAA